MEMHPGTDNSRRPFLPKARRGKERESCHQDNILQQECSMGEDPLTGAVDKIEQCSCCPNYACVL